MRHLIICITLLGFSVTCNAQETEALNALFNVINQYQFNDARVAVEQIEFSPAKSYLLELTKLLEDDGQTGQIKDYYHTENSNDTEVIKAVKLLLKGQAQICYGQTSLNTFNILTDALKIAKRTKSKGLIKQVYLSLLNLYKSEIIQINNDHNLFLKEYKSLASDPYDEAHYALFNYVFISKDPNALEKGFEKAMTLLDIGFSQIPDNHPMKPFYYFEKGIYHEIREESSMAENYYNKTLSLTSDKGFYRYINYGAYLKLSKMAGVSFRFNEALELLNETKKYYNRSNPTVSQYYYKLYGADYYHGLNKTDSVFSFLKDAMELKDSINHVNNTNKRSEALVAYQTLEQEKQLLITQQKKKQTQNVAIALGGGLVAVSLIGFLLFKNSKRKQRIAEQQSQIEIQKTEKILRDQELTTIDAMIEGQEKERQRLASDLHDSVGATLSAAKLQFDHLSKNKDKLGELDELFSKTGKLLDDAYTEVRSMAHIKNSGVLAKNGLLPAIQKLAKNASGTNKLQIDVQDFGLDERLENSLEITVFRIIQELVTNIIKHANASEASISVTQHEDSLNIIVEDDGKGFNPMKLYKTAEGMGLDSIERRVEHLEGSMEVDSSEGNGTTIVIDIPL